MDNQRLFLFLALGLVVMMLFNAWEDQFNPRQASPESTTTSAPATPQDIPQAAAVPEPVPGAATTAPVPTADQNNASASAPAVAGQNIHVRTDLFDVIISTIGGDIRYAALPAYPERADNPDKPVQILFERGPFLYVAQSGLLSATAQSVDHHARFTTQQTEYQLEPGKDSLDVVLHWQDDKGLAVSKTYTFHRNRYVIDMIVEVSNGGTQEWSGRLYRQLQRSNEKDPNQSRFVYTYTGGVVSSPGNKYEKVKFEDMASWKPEQAFTTGGWAAMVQHYFLSAWIPKQDEANHFYSSVLNPPGNAGIEGAGRYILGLQTSESKIGVGQTGQFSSQLYIGPKEQQRLETVAPNLKLTVDYGMLTILAEPVYWLLEKIHGFVNNWGWSIVFVTLIVKLLFYKLSEAAYRSMANMRKFQPKLQALKERYGDDRQRMSQAMMEIYKKEKINPLGGCLPMLVQIPVFISLYWVLLESVELRHADFMLWITDLSSKDPYYVLPLIMGVSMLIQQRLNPAPVDPVQKKVMQVLPIVFTLFFAFFPAGLVLYWVVNNILSILQQWYITRKIEAQSASGK